MADEQLRMTAEVVDKFSTPLRKLRDELRGIRTPEGVRGMEADFSKVARAAGSAASEIRNGIGAALTGLGFGALTATGAIAGLAASLRGFSSATAALSALSRETGLSVEKLRGLESLAERFQIAPDALKNGVQQFSSHLYDIRRRYGETYGWLQSRDATFTKQLFDSKSTEEALGRAFGFLAKLKDPIQRMRAAEKLFGNAAIGRLGSEGLSGLMKQWSEVQRDLGKLPPSAAQDAEAFERSITSLTATLRGLRDSSAAPVLRELDAALKGIGESIRSSGFAEWLGKEVKQTIADIKELIESVKELIDWFGKAGRFLSGNGASGVGGGNHGTAGQITPFLGAPMSNATGPMFAELKRRQDQLARLEEIIQRKEGSGQDASSSKLKRDQLVDEIKALREKMRESVREGMKEGAADLIQKQSYGGGGGFGGMIQNASLGGAATGIPRMGGGGRFNGLGGGGGGGAAGGTDIQSTPGASGEDGQRMGGSRSWRNRNPGNIEFGPFAKSMGAIGSDGRFAIFPTEEAGRKAQERLLFESKGYRDLTLPQAISKWAPGSENNVPAYIAAMGGDRSGRRMSEYSPEERGKLMDAMRRHEGWRAGSTIAGGSADGLNVKPGAGTGHPGVMALARMMQSSGYAKRFTAFADAFHKNRPGSLHNKGLAGDFSLIDPKRSQEAAKHMRETMRAAGLSDADMQVLDEYANPSPGATGGHMHYGFRSGAAADRFAAWAKAREDASATAGLRRSGDALMMRGAAAQKVEGDAKLSIDLKGFPRGTAFSTETSGMFKEVHLDRGRQMAETE